MFSLSFGQYKNKWKITHPILTNIMKNFRLLIMLAVQIRPDPLLFVHMYTNGVFKCISL